MLAQFDRDLGHQACREWHLSMRSLVGKEIVPGMQMCIRTFYILMQYKSLQFMNYLRLQTSYPTIIQNNANGSKRSCLPQGHEEQTT